MSENFFKNNKEEIRIKNKEYYLKNREKILEKNKKNQEKNKDKISLQKKIYYLKNKEKLLNIHNEYNEKNKKKISIQKQKYYLENKEQKKKYYIKNKQQINEVKKIYRKENKLKTKYRNLNYYEKNKEIILKVAKKYRENRGKIVYKKRYDLYSKDPNWRMVHNLKHNLARSLKKHQLKKEETTLELLGIKLKYFRRYLEHKFKPGMTWDNYGKVWHLDHIIPLSIIDISKKDNLKFACNYRNLQPLFARENLSKNNKIFIEWENHMKLRDFDPLIKNILKRCHPDQEFDLQLINEPKKRGLELVFKNTIN
jgi:hypothetical protein